MKLVITSPSTKCEAGGILNQHGIDFLVETN